MFIGFKVDESKANDITISLGFNPIDVTGEQLIQELRKTLNMYGAEINMNGSDSKSLTVSKAAATQLLNFSGSPSPFSFSSCKNACIPLQIPAPPLVHGSNANRISSPPNQNVRRVHRCVEIIK